MEIKYWEGGLQRQEILAIEKIKKEFSEPERPKEKLTKGNSLQDLGKLLPGSASVSQNPLYNWKGYAGFRFVDSKGNEGEFDLLLITHNRILIIELKDWNHKPVTNRGDSWFKGNKNMGRSPVSVTQNKIYLIKNKIGPLKDRFTNRGYFPFIEFLVVMTGDSDFSGIRDNEKKHTVSLKEFLSLSDKSKYDKRFPSKHSLQEQLYKDIHLFDNLFIGLQTESKPFSIDGWMAKKEIFQHPKGVYKEYLGVSESSKNEESLIRRWNFNRLDSTASKTPDGRFEIVSREREILRCIREQKIDLYNHCLTSLTIPQKDNVTELYYEVYELPPSHKRFNEFIGKYGVNFDEADRISLVKLLTAKFSDLHQMKIAHRDMGDHSIWISPAKEIALSNFISAYHQPIGTVGLERTSLSVNEGAFPLGMPVSEKTTPFQMDVYSLGLLAWHILQGKRLSPESINSSLLQIKDSEAWYAPAIEKALDGDSYRYADDLFSELKMAEPQELINEQFDLGELEGFRDECSHTRKYREDDDFIIETSSKEVYVSKGKLVKAWLNINPLDLNPGLGRKLLYFLERVDRLQTISPSYLADIHDFGIANKSCSLFLVTDYIDGLAWGENDLSEENKWVLISQLVSAVEHLHGLGFAHGDLKPSNVIIERDDNGFKLYLIDIPDFCHDSDSVHNTKYSPENIDSCSDFDRDIFAIIRMSSELLNIEWGDSSEVFPAIAKAIQVELHDLDFGFKDLARFKDALLSPSKGDETDIDTVTIRLKGDFETVVIYPDNEQLFVQILENRKSPSEAMIQITGVGGSVKFFYSKDNQSLTNGLPPRLNDGFSRKVRESAHLDLPFALRIVADYSYNLDDLNTRLKDNAAFQVAIEQFFKPKVKRIEHSEDIVLIDESKDISNAQDKIGISTKSLWQAVIDTEVASHPFIKISGDTYSPKNNSDQIILPYVAEKDALDGFDKKDDIEAIQINGDNENKLGEVVLKSSQMSEVRLSKVSNRVNRLKDGDVIFFRSKADKSSFEKRKNALERLIKDEAVISGLSDLFEPDCKRTPLDLEIEVTDDDFAVYDREDDHGNKISLNEKQRAAFQQLVNYGPLSMLQGPPGTGKTEFIAAFVHYLITKQSVQNILLVSQSHEAVNTAAERIRNHCRLHKTPLEIVRFSNRQAAVSDGLKDVYSQSLVDEKRELFKAEIKYRVMALAQPLGLDEAYLKELVALEFGLISTIDSLVSLKSSILDLDKDQKDVSGLKSHANNLEDVIAGKLEVYQDPDLQLKDDLLGLKAQLLVNLNFRYNVRPDEASSAKALIKISKDMIDVLGTERVNYDEFLARSRQLVTGTCVGIGQRHIGIANNQYDWVIIDEAARSIASELAIAMQAGKRVLLVGDHKQLPPLYSEPHKKELALKLGVNSNDIDDLVASDFARAFESEYGKRTGAQLLTQYRMAPAIGSMVSHCFYENKLENGERIIPPIYGEAPKFMSSYVTWMDTSKLGKKANHNSDRGVSIYNRAEAEEIINLLNEVSIDMDLVANLADHVKEGEAAIGVICMYGEQKRILRQKFKEQAWDDKFKSLIKIDTVDSYQGKENRIIILSITRSDIKLKPGFLRSPNRINVALSRAMDRLIIVGNADMWRGHNKMLPLGEVLSYIEQRQDEKAYQRLDVQVSNKKGKK